MALVICQSPRANFYHSLLFCFSWLWKCIFGHSLNFRTFRCPLFSKPLSWLELFFCRFLQQTSSSLRNISSCLKVGISVAPDFWQTGAENESTIVGNCGKRSSFQAFNENMNQRKPIYVLCKEHSVQETCAKSEILQITWKKSSKEH